MKKNWTKEKIIFELHSRNITLSSLSKQAGLAPNTLRNALRVKYPKAEAIIANAIGVPPQEIWAERYE